MPSAVVRPTKWVTALNGACGVTDGARGVEQGAYAMKEGACDVNDGACVVGQEARGVKERGRGSKEGAPSVVCGMKEGTSGTDARRGSFLRW